MVKDFEMYAREEPSSLRRCLGAAFGASSDSTAWSGEFLLSDMGTYQILVERTEVNPLLHYSLSMGIAPAPFSRTTVVEILPAYVVSNETSKALWFCEAGGSQEARCHLLEPGSLMEFHPQGKKPVSIVLTAVPQKGLVRRDARADLSWETGEPELPPSVSKEACRKGSNCSGSGNTSQTAEDAAAGGEGKAGAVWSGPIEIDSARLVQVRHQHETQPATQTAAGTTGEPPSEAFCGRSLVFRPSASNAVGNCNSGSSSSFCLTEVEVCLYAGSKFVRLREPSIPDYVLVNKTSFVLFVGQHGVSAYEPVLPVPRQHLKKSYEFLGRYGLPFAFYDPTKEKKLEVWRMSSGGPPPSGHRLSGRLSHLQSRLRSGRASAGVGQEASCRVDAATMRRIRREYAETISLKTSQGQPGLIRLVLQSSAGGPLPGGPPASPVERVVVCVRRPIVKGSTYLVFFEASRAAPEAAEPPPLATAAAPARATACAVTRGVLHEGLQPLDRHRPPLPCRAPLPSDCAVSAVPQQGERQRLADASLGQSSPRQTAASRSRPLSPPALLSARADAVSGLAGASALAAAPSSLPPGLFRELLERRGGQSNAAGESDEEEESEHPPLYSQDLSVNLVLVGAGLSLIDSKPAEILYASVELLQLSFKSTQEGEKLRLSVGWVQVDNHAPMAYYPTMLRPITDARAADVSSKGVFSKDAASQHRGGVDGGEAASSAEDPEEQSAAEGEEIRRRRASRSGVSSRDKQKQGPFACFPAVQEADAALGLHSEDAAEGLKLLEEENAVGQLILERRNTVDGRGLTVIPQCVLRLAPLSVNMDFQLAFSLLLLLDDLLRTVDLDLLQQSVKDVRTSETEPHSPSWRAMLGPVEGAMAESMRGSGDSVGKVYLGVLDVGRVMLVINIRNKRQGTDEEEQPHSELIRGVLAIMKSSPYISDANLVFASEEFRRGLALWGTPGFAFISFGRGFARCGAAFVAGVLDSSGRFFGSWFQCFEAFARNSDAYSVMQDVRGQGGVTDQPGSIAEGLISGGKGFAFTFALSLANFCGKPFKATQLHLLQQAANSRSEKFLAGAKGLAIGSASALGSLCFGVPSSLLLLLSSSCVGALNQIQAVPMLDSVRPRRVFCIGSWRPESYSFSLATAQSTVPRAARSPPPQLVFAIPVYRQRGEGEARLASEERVQRLEQRLQKLSRVQHHSRRRKPQTCLAVGLRRLGLLEGKRVIWSCFRGDVAQIQIVQTFSGEPNNPTTNSAFFLTILHFRAAGKPPPDEGLCRHVKEGFKHRADLGDSTAQTKAANSTISGSSYSSSSSSRSSSTSSSSTYSDEDEDTDALEFDYSETSEEASEIFEGPLFKAPSSKEQKGAAPRDAPPAPSTAAEHAEAADSPTQQMRQRQQQKIQQRQQQQMQQRQQQEPNRGPLQVLKKAKVGKWLLGRRMPLETDPLKQTFVCRWVEFSSKAAALHAFDLLSQLLDSPPGQGLADVSLYPLL
ncbi:uncharacterized protein LOC34621939 [Cyclospora cayetanensis]|uniref:Uncharacterized protein LOC34621939 n=1 Tax=Cyclospora cayetanensis TaxID=88456 RepID=A0A6P6S2Z1_9EIME|nr:uncharacterized protein LOC34621939 [Cyclospora cayetanensis]